MGEERAGRAAAQDRAMWVLTVEAVAAERRRGLLPGPAWWGEEGGRGPPRAGRVAVGGPPRRCSAAHPSGDGTTHASTKISVHISAQRIPTTGFGQISF